MHSICKLQPKFRIGAQLLEQTRRTLVIIKIDRVIIDALKRALAVPNKELEPPRRIPSPRRIPIGGTIPIGIRAVKIGDHVVDERRHIEHLFHPWKLAIAREPAVGQREHFVPSSFVAFENLIGIHGIVILRAAAEMRGGERSAWALAQIVEAPVQTVQIEVHKHAARRWMPHCAEGVAHPLIANEVSPPPLLAAPMQPGIVVSAPENERVEFIDAGFTKQRKFQHVWAPPFLEQEPKRVLRAFFRPPIPTALNADSAIDRETI